jgi:nicotinamide phosphoribosyltransferase
MIDEAEKIITAHGLPFYREGWEYIVSHHKGKLPVLIKGLDEGTVLPPLNALVTIVNTDPACWWLTSFLETALLRAVWYPTTVASNSYHSKEIILAALKRTGDPSLIDFKLHDFGARGVSLSNLQVSVDPPISLTSWERTPSRRLLILYDTMELMDLSVLSIPAMEHSTVTSWGRDAEEDSFRNMLAKHGKPGGLIACVSDSYDIYEACKLWGTKLKDDVISSGATVVVRPDSGEPSVVVTKCAQILDKYFGSSVNDKGFKVLNNVRIIQGDGIDHQNIRSILFSLTLAGFSADNIAFGQGGALLQQVNRDTLKFAMKCSAAKVNGEWRDVYKDPVTDKGKKSKRGILAVRSEDATHGVGILPSISVNSENTRTYLRFGSSRASSSMRLPLTRFESVQKLVDTSTLW